MRSRRLPREGNDGAAGRRPFLVEKYPSNRNATAARAELEGAPEPRSDRQ